MSGYPAFTEVQLIGLNVPDLSLSAGMTLLAVGDELDDALQRADRALYRAKRDGRNRCAAAWETSMPELTVGERQWTVAAGSNLLDALNQQGWQSL